MKNLFPFALALTACAGNTAPSTASIKDTAEAASKYDCATQFLDTAIQAAPLWTEAFEADLEGEAPFKKFGVSPADGTYYATVSRNSPSGILVMILNQDTQRSSAAVFEDGARSATIIFQTSNTQTLELYCVRR